ARKRRCCLWPAPGSKLSTIAAQNANGARNRRHKQRLPGRTVPRDAPRRRVCVPEAPQSTATARTPRLAAAYPARIKDVFDIAVLIKRRLLNFALVAFQDVVEIGGDREGFAFGSEILRRHVDKELVPALLVKLGPDRRCVDPRVPVEAPNDPVGLDLGA